MNFLFVQSLCIQIINSFNPMASKLTRFYCIATQPIVFINESLDYLLHIYKDLFAYICACEVDRFLLMHNSVKFFKATCQQTRVLVAAFCHGSVGAINLPMAGDTQLREMCLPSLLHACCTYWVKLTCTGKHCCLSCRAVAQS